MKECSNLYQYLITIADTAGPTIPNYALRIPN